MIWSYPLAVLDAETTGLQHQEHSEIIEIGIVVLNAPDALDGQTLSSLICPRVLDARADRALAVNRITPAELRTAPCLEVVLPVVVDGLRQLGARQLAAYGNFFDQVMWERSLRACRVPVGPTPEWGPCIMETAGRRMKAEGYVWPERRHSAWPSLERAAEWAGVARAEPAHRALSDARVAAGVVRKLEEVGS